MCNLRFVGNTHIIFLYILLLLFFFISSVLRYVKIFYLDNDIIYVIKKLIIYIYTFVIASSTCH